MVGSYFKKERKRENSKTVSLQKIHISKKKIAKRERGTQELQVSFFPVSLTWRWQTRDFSASITVRDNSS